MKKLIAVLLTFLTLTMLLPSCSGSKKPAENSSAAPETNTKTIKVGVAFPLTGNYAEYGKGMTAAVELAAKEFNDVGGVKGRNIELVIMDSKGDAKEASDIARIFTGNNEIVAVMNDFSSTCSMAAAPIYNEAGLVQLSPTASHPDFAAMGDYSFGTIGRQDDEGPFMAKQVAQRYMGAKSVGIIYINNDWGVVTTKTFSTACDEVGLKITAKENFVEGEKDFTTALNKVRQTNPEVLVLMMQHNECAMICKQIKQMGWNIKVMSAGSVYTEQLLTLGGADVEGLISESPFIIEENNERGQAFIKAIQAKVNLIPGIHAAGAYDGAGALFAAIKNTPELTRSSIRDTFAATKNYDGLAGPITFTETGDVHRKYRIITIENKKWKALTDYDYYK